MDKTHDTFADLDAGTPWWFTLSALALPIGLFGQFLSAGTALFRDAEMWGLHGAIGGTLAIPVLLLVGGAVLVRPLRGFGWWAGLTLVLYVLQIALAAGANPLPLSLHPFGPHDLDHDRRTVLVVIGIGLEVRRLSIERHQCLEDVVVHGQLKSIWPAMSLPTMSPCSRR